MRMLSIPLLVGVLLVPVRKASAQASVSANLRPSASQLQATSALLPTAASVQPAALMAGDPILREHGSRHEGAILMFVGAAGIVTGLIVDEPVVTVLSAGIAGIGLFLYIR